MPTHVASAESSFAAAPAGAVDAGMVQLAATDVYVPPVASYPAQLSDVPAPAGEFGAVLPAALVAALAVRSGAKNEGNMNIAAANEVKLLFRIVVIIYSNTVEGQKLLLIAQSLHFRYIFLGRCAVLRAATPP